MKEELKPFVIEPEKTILEALQMIDRNKKGFLVVLGTADKVLGTLTDGDIRRAFLKGYSVNEKISLIFRKEFKSLTDKDNISAAVEMFKSQAIKFIPVLNEHRQLSNIITKAQMHALLLQDIRADLNYEFSSLDEEIVDYEIFHKPWGFYKTTVMNDYFQSKIICVNPMSQLSLQSHNHREEHWIVAHGMGTAQIGSSIIEVTCGSTLFIPKGCKHRLSNTSEKENLIITEVQIGDYFGEDDIIRYEDRYGRGIT